MFAELISEHPRVVILAVVVSLIISGYYASQVRVGVNTGNFELKNKEYKTYKKIVETFGSEADDVIVIAKSDSGYILNRGDMRDILELEIALDKNVSSVYNESIVDYILTGIKLIELIKSIPPNLNVKLNESAINDTLKMKDAVGNYRYVMSHANSTTKNDTYRIYILLPEYSGMLNMSAAGNGSGRFTYPDIIKHSKYRDTVYNATSMLISEIEIYQNITRYSGEGGIGIAPTMPEHYSITFLNRTIEKVEFNITRAKVGMEQYNATYMEWYAYNTSFNLASSLLYSGYSKLAESIYRFDRSTAKNATAMYSRNIENWTEYENTLGAMNKSQISVMRAINATTKMENLSYGTLRDFLKGYRATLEDYLNGSVAWIHVKNRTWEAKNMSDMKLQSLAYSLDADAAVIPLLNETISAIENNSGERQALLLSRFSEETMQNISMRIAYFYGEHLILKKVDNIFLNLKSIIMGKESDSIKQDAWELLYFYGGINGTAEDTGPLYRALNSYRNTVYSPYYANTSSIMWDYLTLKPFSMNYTTPALNFTWNFTHRDMLEFLSNKTQEDINEGIREIHQFSNHSVETIVRNYTHELRNLRNRTDNLTSDIEHIASAYAQLGNISKQLTSKLEAIATMGKNISAYLNHSVEKVYRLRTVEDFFSLRDTYFQTLLSRDQLATLIIIGLTRSQYEMSIYNISKSHSTRNVEFHTLSSKVLVREIEITATHDLKTLLPISLLILLVLLIITYRSIKAMLLTTLAVGVALMWSFAFMALVGWELDPILLAVPVMIVGIGVDDGIYMSLRYMEERAQRSPVKASKKTIASVGSALLLTTLTSMVGFLSNSISSMEDIQRFGILAAAGLLFSFISMNTFLPALNTVFDTRGKIKNVKFKPARIGAEAAVKAPHMVIAVVLALSLMGIMAFGHLNTEFSLRDLAPANSEIVEYYHYYEKNFNASVEYSYIYMQGNMSNPAVLKAIAQTQKNIEDDSTVVHQYPVISPWSIMEMYAHAKPGEYYYNATFIKLFHESDVNHDGFPDRNLTKLYSMLEPEISRVLRGNTALIIIRTDSQDLKKVNILAAELNQDAAPLRKYVRVEISGDAMVGKASLDEINENQLRSLFLSITAAMIMLILLFFTTKKSIVLGIIAAIPIMIVVTWNWLLMYILGISLNVMTNTIASLCVGLGVDYGIHITHRFVEESDRYYDLRKALFRATEHLGRGMVGAAATTIAAIGILVFSTIPPLSNFALILSFSILFAFVASIFILPTLLILWAEHRRKHGHDPVDREVKEAINTGNGYILCKYHVTSEACVIHAYHLVKMGKIKEARKLIEKLKEEGIDLSHLLRGQDELHPPYE